MTNRTQLAAGEILNGITLSIWLVQPADKPESVVVMWPQRPTVVSPATTRSWRRRCAVWWPMPAPSWPRSRQAGGDDHQHALSTNRGGYSPKYPSWSPKCSARSSLST